MAIVSIITPVLNREKLISYTIESIQKQSFSDWQLLIIDDGSIDKTIEVVNNFAIKDKRIKLFLRDKNIQGAPICRNIGIEKALSEYVIFLDSDDLLKPFALEQRIKIFKEYKDYDFLVFQTIRMDYHIQQSLGFWYNFKENEDYTKLFLSLNSPWQTAGVIWKLESIRKYNLFFDTNLRIWQDVDYHLQALLKGMKFKIFKDLPADVLYRINNKSLSQKAYDKNQRKSQIYFIKKYKKIYSVKYPKIAITLINRLIKKNLQQKFYDNLLKLLWLKYIRL